MSVPKLHIIKLSDEFADAILFGDKTFEVRENDRGYQKGDLVQFDVIDKYQISTGHPLTEETYRITYVLNGWGIEPKFVVFGIKNVRGEEE
ncbi:MAG: DUF3850 domain-containing protein [Lachnospiraceae bacterium]|nr:DUF3850 domain-containing protein [Lachnospiraceae bacterium]